MLSGLALASFAACAPVYENHGYAPTDEDLAKIVVGRDTRETVEVFLGPPSMDGLLNDKGWYYVQSRWKNQGLVAPKEIDRQVVAISFDDKGFVTNIERFGLERGQVVSLSRRVTTEPVKSQSILTQLFSNIGLQGAAQQTGGILNQ
jgi:outer membrane protein assembly factor BamE (lipoprotein component of BamABCDE complex)